MSYIGSCPTTPPASDGCPHQPETRTSPRTHVCPPTTFRADLTPRRLSFLDGEKDSLDLNLSSVFFAATGAWLIHRLQRADGGLEIRWVGLLRWWAAVRVEGRSWGGVTGHCRHSSPSEGTLRLAGGSALFGPAPQRVTSQVPCIRQ